MKNGAKPNALTQKNACKYSMEWISVEVSMCAGDIMKFANHKVAENLESQPNEVVRNKLLQTLNILSFLSKNFRSRL